MRSAIGIPNVGLFGAPEVHVELAGLAEQAGWDGVFVWDHLLYHEPEWPVADPTVVLAALAATTERVRIACLMTALPRRRPWKLAKELATIDHLSGGRLTVGAALGSMDREYTAFGEDADLRARAAKLDDGLAFLDRALRGDEVGVGERGPAPAVRLLPATVQRPRPPIWVGGSWPNPGPFRRAARWDGVMPVHPGFKAGETMPPSTVAEIHAHVASQREDRPFDLALEGATTPGRADTERLAEYERAGVTWWVEALGWWRGDLDDARRRVSAGPIVA
jgi:alkanesulfonate monooxygenase SsuD/methylene tetrahydromethanopterin reductase-like flavin-dependent oxidoreductase (luciferase family)